MKKVWKTEDSRAFKLETYCSKRSSTFKIISFASDACKKDILLLLDTSNSIGRNHFDNDVKPFLSSLVNSPKLNVGPDGTQLALVTFSNDQNTRMRFGFARRTVQDYQNYFDQDLTWDNVHGDRTMTGDGARIADTQVSLRTSPTSWLGKTARQSKFETLSWSK